MRGERGEGGERDEGGCESGLGDGEWCMSIGNGG